MQLKILNFVCERQSPPQAHLCRALCQRPVVRQRLPSKASRVEPQVPRGNSPLLDLCIKANVLLQVARPHCNLVHLHGSREFPHARDAMKYTVVVGVGEQLNSASCLRGGTTTRNSMNLNVLDR